MRLPHPCPHTVPLTHISLARSQDFPRLRDLKVLLVSGLGELQPFTSVEWPKAGVHYPAMNTLKSLEICTGYSPRLLPPTIDLRKICGLRHVTLRGDLFAEGDEAQRGEVLKLQPHVTVSYEDYE